MRHVQIIISGSLILCWVGC